MEASAPDGQDAFRLMLESEGRSRSTIASYCSHLRRFLASSAAVPGAAGVEAHLNRLAAEGKSESCVSQARSALRLYWTRVLGLPDPSPSFRATAPHPAGIMSREEIAAVLSAAADTRARLAIALMYSSGLRVGEVVRLRRRSIDTDSMVVRVSDAAGRTVRETVLSRYCAGLVSDYLATRTDDSVWLVPGRSRAAGISPRTLHRMFAGAVSRAGIGRRCGLGCLRHSFAVHMLEDGFDRRLVGRLLGVGSRTTMAAYARLAGRGRPWVRSPLDRQFDPGEGLR